MPLSKPSLLATGLLAALAIPLLVALNFLESHELGSARHRVQADVFNAASKLEMFLSDRLRALRLLANHLAAQELDKASFTQAAADFNLALPGLKAINWIQPDGTITWVYPIEGNQAAQGRNVLDHPEASPSFRIARRSHVFSLTPPLELFQGTWGVASYTPVIARDETKEVLQASGYLNGVFELNSIIALALEPELLDHYHVKLVDGDRQIYPEQSADDSAAESAVLSRAALRMVQSTSFLVHDRTWKLTMRPSPGSWIHNQKSMFLAARWASLFLSAAIALGVYQLLIRRRAEYAARIEKEHMLESLRQSQKLEAVGRLAGNVAHDFNNLMTTIMGNAALLESSGSLEESEQQRLKQIQLACDRATGLTSQLLAFSSQGLSRLDECEIQSEIQLLMPLLRAFVPGEIEVQFDGDHNFGSAVIGWAPTQLAQVLTNLVSNAADAYEGPGKIQLSLKGVAGSNQVCIEVRDQGCGISAADLTQVTQPFFTTKPPGRGTGLGLASVARIVETANGELRIKSEPKGGTTVSIRLPILPSSSQPSAPAASPTISRESLRVLLVEDKAPVRDAICSLLEDLGHRVIAVESGRLAMEQMEADNSVDLIVSDFKMPGMTGAEMVRQLRAQGVTIPVVVCSGYAENLDAEEILNLKVAFLPKPFAADALARAITTAFEMANKV
jgi:signal transduction histidine kinase/CheY-like chemotaxis protein